MKVLVTGGKGMLGMHIEDKLYWGNHEGIFVGSKDKVYLLKHGTDDDGITYEYALDKDKRYSSFK